MVSVFDLMGVHDIETMNDIYVQEVNSIDPTIFIYGEGWVLVVVHTLLKN